MPGDVITSINGRPVGAIAPAQAQALIRPGSGEVQVVVDRGGRATTIRARF